jgi:trans-2,3-dihydro-3-hydroxyanthranilate isomerase
MELDYFIVDVFTTLRLQGNALAVVIDSAGLSADRMQAIAREFNLSETTFVQRRAADVEQREGVRVRIFTTQEELPFAGHPTLGTATVLKLHAPDPVPHNTVTLALQVGAVPVEFSASDPCFGVMTQPDPEFGAELDPGEVARLTALAVGDLDPSLPPQVVSTGTAFAIVALRSDAALARLSVQPREASDWLKKRGARWFYVIAPTPHKSNAWHARMQFNGGEDPATGSAAGCAISYLVERRVVPSDERILLSQGVEMGRPSSLYLSASYVSGKVNNVRVGGSTVLVAKGRLFLS